MDKELLRFREILDKEGHDIGALRYDALRYDKPPRTSLRRRYNASWLQLKALALGEQSGTTNIERQFDGDSGYITTKSLSIQTVEDALEAADVDRKEWEVDRYVINSWEVTMSAEKANSDKPQTFTNWQVKVWLKRRIFDKEGFFSELIDEMKQHAPNYRLMRGAQCSMSIGIKPQRMQEIDIMDLHYGKNAWGEETGEDYDKDICKARLHYVLEDLIEKGSVYKPEMFLLPIGNDLMHVDTLTGTTTKGTRQDVDDRISKLFKEAGRMCVDVIDRLMTIAPVHVLIIPGNHDFQSIWHLGAFLNAWYRNCDVVVIDDSPTARKYIHYGANLIGFSHGCDDDPKSDKLPLIMAQEEPKAWADTVHREWHTGHVHKRKQTSYTAGDTFNGVHVRVISSLSGTDFWHYQKGFVKGEKIAESFIWDFDHGCIATLFSSTRFMLPMVAQG